MRFFPILWLVVFYACRNQPAVPVEQQLTVLLDQTTLYMEPGEKSQVARTLKKSDVVADLNEVSNFETTIQYAGAARKAPWLKVQTADNQTGWLFAVAVRPVVNQDGWLAKKQMISYFGPSIAVRHDRWLETRKNSADEQTFATQYREAVALRDTFIQLLQNRADPTDNVEQNDFLWLRSALPGFVFQWVAEGTQPYLFVDYKQWQPVANTTTGTQDDLFVQTCLMAFAADSIESFFPAWVIQTTDYESASQLGSRQHEQVLQAIDRTLAAGNLFQPQLKQMKDNVLADILDKNRSYWQPQDKIVSELTSILAHRPACLDERDVLALQTRRQSFENPAKNGIRVNLRSGE